MQTRWTRLVGAIVKVFKSLFGPSPLAIILGAFLNFGAPAYGHEIPGYPNSIDAHDPREIALLPPYCIQAQLFSDVPGASPAEHRRYLAIMGKDRKGNDMFLHMHHYCWGLMKTNRAVLLARDPKIRRFYLEESIPEFDYVIRNATNEFALLPEIVTKKGENLLRLGRHEGIAEFQRAIDLKPDYWPPYAALSDHFKQTQDLARAREWLEKGLAVSPNAQALQRRLAELGGGRGQQSTQQSPSKNHSSAAPAIEAPSEKTESRETPTGR